MDRRERQQELYRIYRVSVFEGESRAEFSADNAGCDINDNLTYTFRDPEQLLEAAAKYLRNNPNKQLQDIEFDDDMGTYDLILHFH